MPAPRPSGIVTLLTDFGHKDPFVGLLHAVVLSRFRDATIVDLSHGVAPQAVDEASFWLERCYRWFPPGTVHLAVVDPEVGTARAALAVAADGHTFVAPDSGVLGFLAGSSDCVATHIDLARLALGEPSRTFHGRDVFAPVAAELAAGRSTVESLGPRATLSPPARRPARPGAGGVEGTVVSIDHFGNLVSDVEATHVAGFDRAEIVVGGVPVPLAGTYAEVPRGELVAMVSSFGTVEVAVREGSAAARLGVSRGAPVLLRSMAR